MLHKAGPCALHPSGSCPSSLAALRLPSARSSRTSALLLPLCAAASGRHCKCNTATVDAVSVDSGTSSFVNISSSSTSLQLRQSPLMQQLLEGFPQQQQQQQQGYDPDETPGSTAAPPSSSSRATGFGGKQQQRSDVRPDAACPCKSGLPYKACCQPFVAATAYPKSAPELVRARITAALAGKPEFLVSSTHPDSSLALGGRRSLASRAKRQSSWFRRNKFEVAGMAHCPGDEEGTWLVLAILQAGAGEFKGEKAPYMELIARRSWNKQQQQQQPLHPREPTAAEGGAAAAAGASVDRWMFYKQTNQLPSSDGAGVLTALLQQHVPELLLDAEGDDAAAQQGVMGRQVYFNWVTPCFGSSSSSSSSSSSWYVDLLTPAVERLGTGIAGNINSSGSSSASAGAAAGGDAYRHVGQQQLLLLPPGVFRMDVYLEQQRELRRREDERRQEQQRQRERLRGNIV